MAEFDEENLTEADVDYLLQTLKQPSKIFTFQQLRSRIETSITLTDSEIDGNSVILGVIDGIEYILHVFCGDPKLPKLKYTINLRFKKSDIQLIRVDVGGRHKNPGEKVAKTYPHVHIYNPHYAKKDRVAYPLDPVEFPNVQNIMQTFEDVLDYTNIQE